MIPRFRVWLKKKKKMVATDDLVNISFEDEEICVQTLYFEEGLIIERDLDYYEFDEIEFMQSTGVKDKNGKEVFEGDILTSQNYPVKGVVEFRTDLGLWVHYLKGYNYFEYLGNVVGSKEIIGNIYENKDILEDYK